MIYKSQIIHFALTKVKRLGCRTVVLVVRNSLKIAFEFIFFEKTELKSDKRERK